MCTLRVSSYEYEIEEGLSSNIACGLIDEEARNSKDRWMDRNKRSACIEKSCKSKKETKNCESSQKVAQ